MGKLKKLDLKEWEKEIPFGVGVALNNLSEKDSSEILKGMKKYDLKIVTSLGKIREIARKYSKRYKIPIKIDEEKFDTHPNADAFHSYSYGNGDEVKGVIYLHPILQYYPEIYIKGVIEHEIDHSKVEKKWSKVL